MVLKVGGRGNYEGVQLFVLYKRIIKKNIHLKKVMNWTGTGILIHSLFCPYYYFRVK